MRKIKYILGLKEGNSKYYTVESLHGDITNSLVRLKTGNMVSVPVIYSFPFSVFSKDASFDHEKYSWVLIKVLVDFGDDYTEKNGEYQENLSQYSDVKIEMKEEIFHIFALAHQMLNNEFERGDYKKAAEARIKLLEEQVLFKMNGGSEISSYIKLRDYKSDRPEVEELLPKDYKFPLTKLNIKRYPDFIKKNLPIDYSLLNIDNEFGFHSYIDSSYTRFFLDQYYIHLLNNTSIDFMDSQDAYRFGNRGFLEELSKSVSGDVLLQNSLSQYCYYLKDFDESKIGESKLGEPSLEYRIENETDLLKKILPTTTSKSFLLLMEKFDIEKIKELLHNIEAAPMNLDKTKDIAKVQKDIESKGE